MQQDYLRSQNYAQMGPQRGVLHQSVHQVINDVSRICISLIVHPLFIEYDADRDTC